MDISSETIGDMAIMGDFYGHQEAFFVHKKSTLFGVYYSYIPLQRAEGFDKVENGELYGTSEALFTAHDVHD